MERVDTGTLLRILFYTAALVGLADGLSTWWVLTHTDLAREANPAVR